MGHGAAQPHGRELMYLFLLWVWVLCLVVVHGVVGCGWVVTDVCLLV